MHLLKLDQSNTVVGTNDVKDPAQFPHHLRLDDSYVLTASPVSIGQVFDSETGTFAPPPRRRWLTKLAFDSRFTMTEMVKVKLAQIPPSRLPDEDDAAYTARCTVPMQLQVMSERRSMASYIDLDRADTVQGVNALEQFGLLAPGRANEILSGPIADAEYFPEA